MDVRVREKGGEEKVKKIKMRYIYVPVPLVQMYLLCITKCVNKNGEKRHACQEN